MDWLQARGIGESKRVAVGVQVRIQPALKSDGIVLDIAAGLRPVMPEVVVVQPRLSVELLALEAKIDWRDRSTVRVGDEALAKR